MYIYMCVCTQITPDVKHQSSSEERGPSLYEYFSRAWRGPGSGSRTHAAEEGFAPHLSANSCTLLLAEAVDGRNRACLEMM